MSNGYLALPQFLSCNFPRRPTSHVLCAQKGGSKKLGQMAGGAAKKRGQPALGGGVSRRFAAEKKRTKGQDFS